MIDSGVLDIVYASTFLRTEAPNELIIQGKEIETIGNLSDLSTLRKLDLSFNNLRSIEGVEKLPQLRYLAAYSCRLTNIADLRSTQRLESLLLQQNGISKIIDAFNSLLKLRELRLDRNKLVCVENIQKCTSLRVLDLSWNKISSVEGIAGLQSLQELRISSNLVSSLKPLRALPSLVELDVSNNQLKSLEGIQQLPTLQTIHAEQNIISTIKIPQTYSHQSKKLDEPVAKKSSAAPSNSRAAKNDSKNSAGDSTSVSSLKSKVESSSRKGGSESQQSTGKFLFFNVDHQDFTSILLFVVVSSIFWLLCVKISSRTTGIGNAVVVRNVPRWQFYLLFGRP